MNSSSTNLLIAAVKANNIGTVAMLLASSNLNAFDSKKHTALHYAFASAGEALSQILYDNGAGLCPMTMSAAGCDICRDGVHRIIEARRDERFSDDMAKFKASWGKGIGPSLRGTDAPLTPRTLRTNKVIAEVTEAEFGDCDFELMLQDTRRDLEAYESGKLLVGE
jgi:ankyrin repeat protein